MDETIDRNWVMEPTRIPRFYRPAYSSHFHEIIERFSDGFTRFATHESCNGWMRYSGRDFALSPSESELLIELPTGYSRGYTSIHTAGVADVLTTMRTVSPEATGATIAQVHHFARENADRINAGYAKSSNLEMEVFSAYLRTVRLVGSPSRKDQVRATVMAAHAIYIARKLAIEFEGVAA